MLRHSLPRAADYDLLGRQTQDRVTTLGTGVDDAVRRIASTYEVRGMREKLTSYDHPGVGSGSIVNEVQFTYNEFGQIVADYQAHSGAVDTMTTPLVQYGYASGSANHIRPTVLTYPNGRELNYDYGSADSMPDAASRIAGLIDDDGSTHLADYSYLGRNTFVETDYTEPEVKWTLVGTAGGDDPDTGDIYRGFDRFGRVKDNYWYDYDGSTDVDRIKYGYDRNGNRTYRENTVAAAHSAYFDEKYLYDTIDRLKHMDRGRLNGPKDGVIDKTFAQCWSLDATGNWRKFTEDSNGDGTWDLDQLRTANQVNEITDLSEYTGPAWVTPAYNRAGNMTTIPKPADPTASFSATYDAWNRLVKLEDGSGTVAQYGYDGAKRRTVKKNYSEGVLSETRHFFYTEPSKWQVVEERMGSETDPDRQFVWGERYIDDLVLRDRDTSDPAVGVFDERLYGVQDSNWNVTGVVDIAGDVLERYSYSAYGQSTALTAGFEYRGDSSYSCDNCFAGYRLDHESQLALDRHRILHPRVGTWVQRDPIGYSTSFQLYEYVNSSPLMQTDPFGLAGSAPTAAFMCVVGAIAGVAAYIARGPQVACPTIPEWLCHHVIGALLSTVAGCLAGMTSIAAIELLNRIGNLPGLPLGESSPKSVAVIAAVLTFLIGVASNAIDWSAEFACQCLILPALSNKNRDLALWQIQLPPKCAALLPGMKLPPFPKPKPFPWPLPKHRKF